jgi:hypothetical protein
MTGRALYERWQELRGATNGGEVPWHSLSYRDKDAWDELATSLQTAETPERHRKGARV